MAWNGAGFNVETNIVFLGGWQPNGDNTLLPGGSVFFVNPTNSITVPFAGLIAPGVSSKVINIGTNFVSSMIPMAGGVKSVLGYEPNNGDKVLLWTGASYSTYTYSGGWSPSEPSVNLGEGFVIVATNTNLWTQSFSACQPGLFVVTANPLWTDTGLMLTDGQKVIFNASGSWNGDIHEEPWCGPGGLSTGSLDPFLSTANDFSLIAFVGPSPYYWGTIDEWFYDNTYFSQGASTNGYFATTNWETTNWVFTTTRSGELWFGFNDDAKQLMVGDNAGFVAGQIVITNGP
jgi:hypothetical protein